MTKTYRVYSPTRIYLISQLRKLLMTNGVQALLDYGRKIALTLAVLVGANMFAFLATTICLAITLGSTTAVPTWLATWGLYTLAPLFGLLIGAALVGFGYAVMWLVRVWRNQD